MAMLRSGDGLRKVSMIGGRVVDVWIWEEGLVSVVVKDLGLLVVQLEKNENSLTVARGDTVWWQDRVALWSSADRSVQDCRIPRIGYSYPVDFSVCPERIAWQMNIRGEVEERKNPSLMAGGH